MVSSEGAPMACDEQPGFHERSCRAQTHTKRCQASDQETFLDGLTRTVTAACQSGVLGSAHEGWELAASRVVRLVWRFARYRDLPGALDYLEDKPAAELRPWAKTHASYR